MGRRHCHGNGGELGRGQGQVTAERVRFEQLTLGELDEIGELTGYAELTGQDFWTSTKTLRAVGFIVARRSDPALTYDDTLAWTLEDVYSLVDMSDTDPTPPAAGGNGSGSPTPTASTPATSNV